MWVNSAILTAPNISMFKRGALFMEKISTAVLFSLATLLTMLTGCATESNRALEVQKVASAGTAYSGPRTALAVGKFDNRSSYMRGLFSDGVDRLGGQAKTILIAHLNQTGRFNVLDRSNMEELAHEASL